MAKKIQSFPTIHAGRDVIFGDISGQVAIGNNIVQYKDCIFLLPDGSTVQGKSWRYTQGVRPATDPKSIFGRRQELEKIEELLQKCSSLAITGIRGTGKSTLASMYVDQMEQTGKYAGIYWRRMDETTDISDIVGSFFTVIRKPIKNLNDYKINDQMTLLLQELESLPYFLVFDNFETLINPKDNKPLKPGFSELIEKAKQIKGESRVIFKCWECPASDGGIRPEKYQVRGLDQQSAIQLLRKNGLDQPETELIQVIERSGGHPKALILLSQLIGEGAKTLSQILENDSLWKGEVAENLLDRIYEERLTDEERKLLQYASIFREPVPVNAIIAVADNPGWIKDYVERLVLKVNRKSLLNKTGDNYWEDSLIQTYAYSKLVDRVSRHKLACDYYLSLPLPEKPTKKEDLQPLIEANYQACMAKEYDKAAQIVFGRNLNRDLLLWGNYRTLVELYNTLLPKDPFKEKPILSEIPLHGTILGSIGIAYRCLGEFEKAIEYIKAGLDIARKIQDREAEGIRLGNLGETYHSAGNLREAIKCYKEALEIATDDLAVGKRLGKLGSLYTDLGENENAINCLVEALRIARESGDLEGQAAHLQNIGLLYQKLGEKKTASECYFEALRISKKIEARRTECIVLGHLGNAYNDSSMYKQALEIARQIGDKQTEGTLLNNLGDFYRFVEKKNEEALACYLQAKRIRAQVRNPQQIAETESSLKRLEMELGEKEFTRLLSEV